MRGTVNFEYTLRREVKVTRAVVRATLADIRDQLLRHDINGGGKKLAMDTICEPHSCGTAACIGGWASIFMLGFEGKTHEEREVVHNLFTQLRKVGGGRVSNLFYEFSCTKDHNNPQVAATAIQRYLDGKDPWPRGEMPNVLPYAGITRPRSKKPAAKK